METLNSGPAPPDPEHVAANIADPKAALTPAQRMSPPRAKGKPAGRILIAVGLILLSRPCLAQSIFDLPTEIPIETQGVELILNDARVEITVDAEARPHLAATIGSKNPDAFASLEAGLSLGTTTRFSRPVIEGQVPTIVVTVSLTPDQALAIDGQNIDLSITKLDQHLDAAEPSGGEGQSQAPPSAAAPAATSTMVRLIDSSFSAHNLGGMALASTGGTNTLGNTTGALVLELTDADVFVRDHRGPVTVNAVDSSVTLEGTRGRITLDTESGFVTAVGGMADVLGTVNNTQVDLDGVEKTIRLTGKGASIRVSNAPRNTLQLNGSDLRITLNSIGGAVNSTLTGGSIVGDRIGGRVDLRLSNGAAADFRDAQSDFALNLTAGSSARLDGVTGHLRVQLDDSDLDVARLRSLELVARGGSVIGNEIGSLSKIEISGSTVELILPDIQGQPAMTLKNGASAWVQLPSPCRVQAKAPKGMISDQVRASGCQLVFDGARKGGLRRGLDGRKPVTFVATVDESSTLEVEGYP